MAGVDQLGISSELYNSPAVVWENEIPEINRADTSFYISDIIAYNRSITPYGHEGVKGIFEMQPDTNSGKIINLGTEDWCLQEDKTLIRNSINYLMK